MANDIEKIIEDSYVPEMEYVKTKRFDAPSEVPEVVLPKTKAEMYEEAKDRLEQKTSAVSKAFTRELEPVEKKQPKTKTTEPKRRAAKTQTKTVEKASGFHRIVDDPKWVGGDDELIPFAWKKPLVDIARPSKFYKQTMRDEKERALLLPVPREK